jgi:hypothetical protein
MTDTRALRPRLLEFLERRGIPSDPRKKPPRFQCPSPGHADAHPSAIYYENAHNLHCPVCDENFDIFDVAGHLDGATDFPGKVKAVEQALGIKSEEPKKKPKLVPFVESEMKNKLPRDELLKVARLKKWGDRIGGAWAYKNVKGQVEILDVRYEGGRDKSIITWYFDGERARCSGAPVKLYNRDELALTRDKPVLIVEGAKCAKIAAQALPMYVVTTWNGGGSKAARAPWQTLRGRSVYIYPDDDVQPDKDWIEQPGIKTAFAIKKRVPQALICKPLEQARKIKTSGADIEEALQIMKPEELAEYIKNGEKLTEPGKLDREKLAQIKFPFRILGVLMRFIGRYNRIINTTLAQLTKNHLIGLAPLAWWEENFSHKGRVSWGEAQDFLVETAFPVGFDPDQIRGRGAWRETDGRICYHDGEETVGKYDPGRIFLRKTRRALGLDAEPADLAITAGIRSTVLKMAFESRPDAIRALCWASLAPFGGALPWRPAGLITGVSGSGKTTVIDSIIRPIAKPWVFAGGDTTEAGIRQRIKQDAAAIVLDEAETDTAKKRYNRTALFSLMRQSTSDMTPDAAKGTRDGRGVHFSMRSMFLFSAISPEIQSVADENRIFKIAMTKTDGREWPEIRSEIKRLITPENCKRIRALVWQKLPQIIAESDRISDLIQDNTAKDKRYCVSDALIIATYLLVWCGDTEIDVDAARDHIIKFYADKPAAETRNEVEEMIDRVLDEKVTLDKPERMTITLRELLMCISRREFDIGGVSYLDNDSERYLRSVAARHGLSVDKKDNVCFAKNHHELEKIIGKDHGYQDELIRHDNLVDKGRAVWLGGKTKRCVVIGGLLDFENQESKEY